MNGNALITTEDLLAQISLVKQTSNSIDFYSFMLSHLKWYLLHLNAH